MKKYTWLIGLLMIIITCEKEDEVIMQYPTKMVVREYKIKSKIRLFTKDGEISNSETIEKFVKKWINLHFFKNIDTVILIDNPDTINFIKSDSVRFNNERHTRKLKINGDIFYFYPKDTLVDHIITNNDTLATLKYKIGKYKYDFKLITLVSPPNIFSYKGKHMIPRIAKGNEKKIVFPMLTYDIVFHSQFKSERQAYANLNNEFDQGITKILGIDDTLAVQEFDLTFEKIE